MAKLALLGNGCIREEALELNFLKAMECAKIERATKLEEADYVLYITCAGVGDTIEQCITEIETLLYYKNEQKPHLKIIITGCLTKIPGLFKEINQEEGIKVVTNKDWIIPVLNYINDENKRNTYQTKLQNRTRYMFTNPTYIQFFLETGCINHCSFCKTNYLSCKVESVPFDIALNYLKTMIKNGTKHIALSGDNLCIYGIDLYKKPVLHLFIRELSKEPGLVALHINEITPQNIYPELLEELRNNPKVISVSMQIESASNNILKLMNRNYTLEEYDYYVRYLKETNTQIDTVLMTGFPTETIEDLDKTFTYLQERQILSFGICQYVDFEYIPSSKLEQLPKREKIRHTAYLKQKIFNNNYQILTNYIPNMKDATLVGKMDGNFILKANNNTIVGVSKSKEYESLPLGTILEKTPKKLVRKSNFNHEMIYKY